MNELVQDADGKTTEFTVRQHLKNAARGDPAKLAELEGPPFPEELRYMYRWVLQLHGRSGVGMAGVAPLSYSELDAWSRFTGYRPTPLEVDGLMKLDAVMRHPETKE